MALPLSDVTEASSSFWILLICSEVSFICGVKWDSISGWPADFAMAMARTTFSSVRASQPDIRPARCA